MAKLLLRADVPGVGLRGDVVDVADGYARNYLVPKGYALIANPGAVRQAAAMRRSRDIRDAASRSSAQEIAKTLVSQVITITARSGPEGKLFGSVSTHDIAEAVAAQTSITLDKKVFILDEHIKTVGSHSVLTKLHSDVEFPVMIEVVGS